MSSNSSHIFCPYCKESIRADAIKCRYCGSLLKAGSPSIDKANHDNYIRNVLKGRYEIFGLIGKGGMASVYKARQINLDRIVALKVIHPNLLYEQEFVDRFLQEARVCAKLKHPNIITVFDFGEAEGIYYMGMELLEGIDLTELLRRKKRLGIESTLFYITPVAHALRHIHQKGFMHRDVKSSNIFITNEGRPVLMDFGIAFAESSKPLTVAGTLLGTPQFLSPEQALGNKAVPESDFYSLGIVMYECLTGSVPFNDSNPMIVINKIIRENPPPPKTLVRNLADYGSDITMGLLHKDPKQRVPIINYILDNFSDNTGRQSFKKSIQFGKKIKTPFSWKKNEKSSSELKDGNLQIMLKTTLILIILILLSGGIFFLINETDVFKKMSGSSDQLNQRTPEVPVSTNAADSNLINSDPALPIEIELAETNMISHNNIRIKNEFITNRLWNIVMNGVDNGNDQPISGISFEQIQSFIEKLNDISRGNNTYRLPNLEEVKQSHNKGLLNDKRNEWVNDPPVFRSGAHPNMAKFYYRPFHDEAAEERKKKRYDIYFRIVKSN